MCEPRACLLLLLLSVHSALGLRICSFNVRSFGESKKENRNTMDVIVKVIKRCDIILLMEIKDSNNMICPTLMEKLNGNSRRGITYNYVISSRLGRNTYKEQYAFLYKEKLVSVKKRYLYHDYQAGDADVFSREPFVIWFQSPYTAVKDFVIVPLHTTPDTSVKEIDELADVYVDVKRRWKAEVTTLCICQIPMEQGQNLVLEGTLAAGHVQTTTASEPHFRPFFSPKYPSC